MALIDVLRNQQTQKTKPALPRTSVDALRNLMSFGQTGKDVARTGPSAVSLQQQTVQQQVGAQEQAIATAAQEQARQQQEQLEQQQAEQAQAAKSIDLQKKEAERNILAKEQQAISQRQAKGEMAAKALTAREEQVISTLNNRFADSLANLASERDIATNDILGDLRMATADLQADQKLAIVHQLGFQLAMADKQYLQTISEIGRLQGLQDDINFKREADVLAFKGDLKILNQRFDMERLLNQDARDFHRAMEEMDIDTALRLADIAAQENNAKNFLEGLTSLGKQAVSWGIDDEDDQNPFNNGYLGDDPRSGTEGRIV